MDRLFKEQLRNINPKLVYQFRIKSVEGTW